MAETTTGPFSPEIIAAIMRHMNDDHADDSVLICRALGDVPAAESARMTGMDDGGILFTAVNGGAEVPVRVPWSRPVTERGQVRAEVVRMYNEACARLGIEPRPPH